MKSLIQLLVAGMLFVFSGAYAGLVFEMNVVINLEDQNAAGVTTTARFSDDPEEGIGCGVRHEMIDGVFDSWGFCQASHSPDVYVNCITFNPELIDRIADVNSYSYITFAWDENGECNYFGFSTQ